MEEFGSGGGIEIVCQAMNQNGTMMRVDGKITHQLTCTDTDGVIWICRGAQKNEEKTMR